MPIAILAALALTFMFVKDALAPGAMSPRWLYVVEGCVGLAFQVTLIAGMRDVRRWTYRRVLAAENRLLQGQADVRTEMALLRAEMSAHLGLLPEGVRAYGERRVTEATLAIYREQLAATGTDELRSRRTRRPHGIATVTSLPLGRVGEK